MNKTFAFVAGDKGRVSVFFVAAFGSLALFGAAGFSLDGAGWRFRFDDSKGATLDASAAAFDDSAWQRVEVPHDWAIAGPFVEKWNGGTGKLRWERIGWYRRAFDLPRQVRDDLDAGGRVLLTFDGVMAKPEVWVNGGRAGGWDYGYVGFTLDVTDLLKPSGNVLAVRADSRKHPTRWYPGGGIYRSVTVRSAPADYVRPGSVFIRPTSVSKDRAVVAVSCERAKSGPTNWTFAVERPRLWDVEDPHLYELKLDGVTYRYGIRTAEWTADDGFHLNGRRVQLKGACLHSDLGPLGMAFNASAARRQLETMRDMGVNAIRTSHNCPDPKLLDLCDEMGLLVWNEAFDKWGKGMHDYVVRNLQAFVRRDRNHPSVVCWSIGNEIPQGEGWGMSKAWFRDFRSAIRELDDTRPVTIAVSPNVASDSTWNEMFDELDLVGFNYAASYRTLRRLLPKKPLVYSESASAVSSFGYYDVPPAPEKTAYATNAMETSGYDHNAPVDIPDVEFARVEADRYLAGEFIWTGIDYLGEPTPYSPRFQFKNHPRGQLARSSYFGACDLCAFPKDRFYLYRSHWNGKSETCHLVPGHWNFSHLQPPTSNLKPTLPVYVYTSGDEAELFLNGRSLGRRKKGEGARPRNLAAGAKATASSENVATGMKYAAAAAVDGDADTMWQASSMNSNEWFQVDMGERKSFTGINVVSPGPICWAYTVLVSDDGANWSVYRRKHEDEWKGFWFKPGAARYVRVRYDFSRKWQLPTIYELCVVDETDESKLVLTNPYYDACSRYRLRWFGVPYEPGELKAVAYRGGKKIAEDAVRTCGKPEKLVLSPSRTDLPDDGATLAFVSVDVTDGADVRDALNVSDVRFRVDGPGEIVAVGNGDPRSHKSFREVSHHPLYFGRALVILRRLPGKGGAIRLVAEADGLASSKVDFP